MLTAPASGRLAYVASRYPVVSHTFVDNEILALEQAGWDLCIASLNPPKDEFLHPRLQALQAPIFYPPPAKVLQAWEHFAKQQGTWPEKLIADHEARFGKASKPHLRARNALWLAARLQQLGVTHVHLHFANAATHTAIFLQELSGIGYSFTPQARDFLVETSAELFDEFCAQARFVVAPCEYASEAIVQRAPRAQGKLKQIYNGINPSLYALAQPGSNGVRCILSVGRMVPMKGFAELITAFAQVAQKQPSLQLRLIGDGDLRVKLEALSQDLGVQEQVIFLGQQPLEVMREEMQRADVFVLAAKYDEQGGSDMLPTVITEAMCCGLPVISSRLAGIPEQVVEGETGRLLEPDDVSGLAKALEELVENPSLAHQWGDAAKARAQDRFSQASSLPRLAQAFSETLEEASVESNSAPAGAGVAIESREAKQLCFYDLVLPQRVEWLVAEIPVWLERGAQVLVAGVPSSRDLEPLKPWFSKLVWLPDGMALEGQWQAQPQLRAQVAKLRLELGNQLDGEILLAAARRAAWILRFCPQQSLYGMGAEESFLLCLVQECSQTPRKLLSCLPENNSLRAQVRSWIASASELVDLPAKGKSESSGEGGGEQGSGLQTFNALLHEPLQPRYRRLGPIKWRAAQEKIPPEQRLEALDAWLKEI